MHFSAALIAALATGAIALPNYGYAEEEPCTEEEAKPTYPAVSTYSVPEAKSTHPAPVHYSSVQSKAPVYSAPAKSEDPEEPCTEEGEYATATYPGASMATGYAPPAYSSAYSSVYSAHSSKATYPAPVYPSGNNGTYPSGVPMPTGGLTTPIYSSTSTTSTYFTPSTTSTSTSTVDPDTTSTSTSTVDPDTTSTSTSTVGPDTTTTTTTEEPTATPTDPGCGSEENPCDGGEVPCDGCDGDPIDGGNVPNDGGPDEEGDSTDAEICGASNTPSCCAVPTGEDGVFVDSPNCSAADAITGCSTGTTYCCPLTDDMSAIDQTMQCAVINLFIG